MICINKDVRISKTAICKVIIVFIVTCFASIYIHESIHYMFAIVDPCIEPLEYHVLDTQSFNRGVMGYVLFSGEPSQVSCAMQEVICYSMQFVIITLITIIYIKKVV